MQIASTHTLELDPAVTWRLVGVRREVALRREAPAVIVPAAEPAIDPAPAHDARGATRARREWGRPGAGATLEFAMFAATLAAIGLLQLQLALLP